MKKFILSAVAAGALAVGGAASAQDLGGILSNIFGLGTPTYSVRNGDTPAVVAGTQPYGQVYTDQYGRQVQIDQYGRQVLVQPGTNIYGNSVYGNNVYGNTVYGGTNVYGGTTYGGVQYDAYGRPMMRDSYGTLVYANPTRGRIYAYGDRPWDRDGDGIENTRDRWPDDPNFF